MRFYKIRGVVSTAQKKVYGITVPLEIASLIGSETNFSWEISGTSLILNSGCGINLTKQQVDAFDIDKLIVK